ncbi:hypothetical protein M413DRAFT_236009 [Hebeloma cylindrosporum]|uniref:Protein kinase domain-containing protein n=1 Tax=Hebeloma cylindrosporum TaxID=76867 RepID=A0A0C2YDM6_HEBCY|nr:hypothetical protein M413DRAFT_236009 [Hebeloma cylindrosporum h7]
MLPAGDPFEKHLFQTLNANITTIFASKKPENPENCQPGHPISFYDRHLASQMVLKHIAINPSIPRLLSQLCDKEIADFVAAGHSLTTEDFTAVGVFKVNNVLPSRLGLHYSSSVSYCCSSITSRMLFHPNYPSCRSVFLYRVHSVEGPGTNFLAEGSLDVDNRLTEPSEIPDPFVKTLDESTTSRMKDLAMQSAHLATWELYAMTYPAHKLLQSMQGSGFKWDRPHVRGIPEDIRSFQIPADASSEFLDRVHQGQKRTAIKLRPLLNTTVSTPRVKLAPALPHRANKKGRPYRPDPSHYLQRAWARAVENDATFIIFHCGDRERIGIRHRESQTLYLSELIDTTACKDPSYGAIQVGLHLAIIRDALQRQKQRFSHHPSSSSKKRPAEDDHASAPDPKRQKVNNKIKGANEGDHDQSILEQVHSILSSRALALLSLNYDAYHSPTPSSFIRVEPSCVRGYHDQPFKEPSRKATYDSSQYFSLVLSEEIGSGAIGVVHRATAEIQLESGLKVQHRLAVKLVFSNYLGYQRRLRKEYSIYHHLASKDNVEGVLPVYGLFEDTETGTLALIMDDGGSSIRYGVSVPDEQRISFNRAMASIHRAGVRHFDLRPNNLLVNKAGETYIIDFDRAQLNPRPQAISQEMACLKHVLDGKDNDNFYSPPPNSYHSESD